jgi:serine protease Do
MDDERYGINDSGNENNDIPAEPEVSASRQSEPETPEWEDVSGEYRAQDSKRREKHRMRTQVHRTNRAATVFTVLLTLCVVGSMGYYGHKYWKLFQGSDGQAEQETESELLLVLNEGEKETSGESTQKQAKAMVLDVSDMVAEVMPSVVAITNKSTQEVEYWFRTMQIENESSGSGFIIARTQDELLIATNAHVVEDATSLSVCFTVENAGEGTQMETAVAQAVIKGMDTVNDLAVVSVAVDDIPEQAKDEITIATMGSSSDLKVGEPAIAIGNALGYGQSVTLGIISALNREVTIDGVTSSLIQTDAAINFGNSGGVLLDVDGNVIGISSAKAASTGVEGMGYAIPIDTAKPILETLMNRVTRTKLDEDQVGYLGVSLRDISTEARSLYNMPEGVFVYEVEGDSPADQAGIRRGDVITYFDGTSVDSRERLGEQLSYYASGEQVEIVLQRVSGGAYQQQTVTVTLG